MKKSIRLTEEEIKIIKKLAQECFGEGTEVYLFGSRVYPEKRGGDIDLYIKPVFKDDLFDRKIKFIAKLWEKLGEQKIDIVFEKNLEKAIEKRARQEGIKL
jgi:predicted nucleotidyltransferase